MALFIPPIPALDNNGDPIDGAEWRFFLTGTTTPATVYADADLETPLGTTVQAQAGGRFPPIFLDPAETYRARLYDGEGSPITNGDFDPYNAASASGAVVTPYMFGAVGDGEADDGEALQAFFDYGFEAQAGKNNIFDFSMAMWGTKRTLYATNEYADPLAELGRKFIGGHIRVLPGATLDTFLVNQMQQTAALAVSGPRQTWEGTLYIDGLPYNEASDPPTQLGIPVYSTRLFDVGVLIGLGTTISFETIRVDGAKRDGVLPLEDTFSWRTGTNYQVDHGEPNNISLEIGQVICRYCGSYEGANTGLSVAVAASTKGSTDDLPSPSFSTTTAGHEGSNTQRQQFQVASTANFAKRDFVKRRMEITSTSYTSVSANATAGTLTLTSGDPATLGLVVGDIISLEDAGAIGLNGGVAFEILDLPGAGVIKVWPKPTTEAAKAYTKILGPWWYGQVQNIRSATLMEVWPWEPTRNNSSLYSTAGYAFNGQGRNLATASIGKLTNQVGGGVYSAFGLYGIHIGEMQGEFCEIGIAIGQRYDAGVIGSVVDQVHLEAVQASILAIGAATHFYIKGGSALSFDSCRRISALSSTTATTGRRLSLGKMTVDLGGEPIISSAFYPPYTATNDVHSLDSVPLSNIPGTNNYAHPFDDGTIKIGFDFNIARLFGQHHKGRIYVPGSTGAGPSGVVNLELTAELVHRGWAFSGDATGTTFALRSGRPCWVDVIWDEPTEKVLLAVSSAVQRLTGTATYNPPSLAAGAAGAVSTITVTGAAVGDRASVTYHGDTQGVSFANAWVSAANTVSFIPVNNTAGVIDLAEATVTAVVEPG